MASVFDRKARQSMHRIDNEERAVRTALRECDNGDYASLGRVLQYLRVNEDGTYDPDMSFMLEHDFGFGVGDVNNWGEQRSGDKWIPLRNPG